MNVLVILAVAAAAFALASRFYSRNIARILGEAVYPSRHEAARHHTIDLVNCFRNSADIPPIVDDAIAIGARGVWMQLGVQHEAAAQRARAAGLRVVQNRCLKIDHATGTAL